MKGVKCIIHETLDENDNCYACSTKFDSWHICFLLFSQITAKKNRNKNNYFINYLYPFVPTVYCIFCCCFIYVFLVDLCGRFSAIRETLNTSKCLRLCFGFSVLLNKDNFLLSWNKSRLLYCIRHCIGNEFGFHHTTASGAPQVGGNFWLKSFPLCIISVWFTRSVTVNM